MSYILDALRRADAERDRGAVPHLHTQAAPMSSGERDDDAPAARPWLWLAAGLALGLLAAVVWALGFRSAPADRAAEATTAMTAPVASEAMAPPTATPRSPVDRAADGAATGAPVASPSTPAATPSIAPSIATPTTTPPSIVPRELPRSPAPALARPEPAATASATAQTAASAPAANKAPAPGPTATTAAPATSPAPRTATAEATPSADGPIRQVAELPEDIRRELPSLAFGGSMYSQNAASRMVIVNGQLLREGDKVSSAVTIEQIRTRSVVLRYKTYRYEMTF